MATDECFRRVLTAIVEDERDDLIQSLRELADMVEGGGDIPMSVGDFADWLW